MKNTDLINLIEICNKATKGPWKSYIEGRDHDSGSNFIMTGNDDERDYDIEFAGIKLEDQDFIATARNNMPDLIAEVIRLRKILDSHSISY